MYKRIIKPILFLLNPEMVHDSFIFIGKFLGSNRPCRSLVKNYCHYSDPRLESTVCGIRFENPIGLAAGFDKNVDLTSIIKEVGFGYMEVGAVTRHPYGGNAGKRLLRLPKDESLIVYYGLKNIGADQIENKIKNISFNFPVGLNIAKTNNPDICGDDSVSDYIHTYNKLKKYFSYVTINISCPNAGDGCAFQEPKMLSKLLSEIQSQQKVCPVFIKISSHLNKDEVDNIINTVEEYDVIDGFVVGNLAKRREELSLNTEKHRLDKLPQGGISGRPIQKMSTELIRHIYKKTSGRYTIIGLGGIFDAEDTYEKIKAGASLVQIITGLIYGGPTTVKKINQGLIKLLDKDGYHNISEAIGQEQHT